MAPMRSVALRDGAAVPAVGQGTWRMGERNSQRQTEVAALRLGLDLGMALIDTAEMYVDGGAERVVADAMAGRRDEVFLVSKVLPQNASRSGTIAACERSLQRLRVERIDLYLLHWEGPHPLADTIAAFRQLQQAGKIARWGVSNFDVDLLAQCGDDCDANQVLYNLARRGPEFDLLPECQRRRVLFMAYSPLDQKRMRFSGALARIAARHRVTAEEVALAWSIRADGVIAVPKAVTAEHVRANAAAADLALTAEDLAELDREFPPPTRKAVLETT